MGIKGLPLSFGLWKKNGLTQTSRQFSDLLLLNNTFNID